MAAFAGALNMSMAGKSVVVTGASAGMGLEMSKMLNAAGARVLAVCRSAPRSKLDCQIVNADFNSLKTVVAAAEEIKRASGEGIDAVICNAGVMATPPGETKDGFESQFGVNHIAHTALVDLLLPQIRDRQGKVILVSSLAAVLGTDVDVHEHAYLDNSNYKRWITYGRSKAANAMVAKALDSREKNISAVSLHPGIVQTELVRYILPGFIYRPLKSMSGNMAAMSIGKLFGLLTPETGARGILQLLGSEYGGGEFYSKGKVASARLPALSDIARCERLLDETNELWKTRV
mmetsp:Transcript_378/g.1275  ORF Transcript_378/g.1275 Transcript_378/m.1275 type:complete len:291 (-) Transcript_378:982-1854(-)